MNKEDINIKLIQDYFAGKLDGSAMHQLEKQALEDPFLAEAMEGYENNFVHVDQNLSEIKSKLHVKIDSPPNKRKTLRSWLVAASILLLVGISTFLIFNHQYRTPLSTAQEIAQNNVEKQPMIKNADTERLVKNADTEKHANKTINRSIIQSDKNKQNAINKRAQDSIVETLLANNLRNEESAYRKKMSGKNMLQSIVSANPPAKNILTNNSIEKELKNNIPSLTVYTAKRFKVLDSFSGNPIAGASVKFKNNNGSLTDTNGYFYSLDTINLAEITAVGYAKKFVDLNNNTVMLSPARDNLNDVVITGYGVKAKKKQAGNIAFSERRATATPTDSNIRIRGNSSGNNNKSPLILIDGKPDSIGAVDPANIKSISVLKDAQAASLYGVQGRNGVVAVTTKNYDTATDKGNFYAAGISPKTGWKKFNKYVNDAVKKSNLSGDKGTVTLRFSISANGKPVNFEIVKSLDDEINQRAIQIVQDGPLWNNTPNGTPITVTYTVEFK